MPEDMLGFDHGEVQFPVATGPGALAVFARMSHEVRALLGAPGRNYFSIKAKQRYKLDTADIKDDGSAYFRMSYEVSEFVTAEPLLAPRLGPEDTNSSGNVSGIRGVNALSSA
jgi:hypothetical protein